jgi:hypothetical protein
MPRWVKVSLIIAGAIVILIVIVLLFGGDHGPSRHTGLDDRGDRSATTQVR